MRPTIHQITEEKTFYRRERDAFGNRTVEDYQKAIPRKVELVTGLPRLGHYLIDAVIIGIISFAIRTAALSGGLELGYSFRLGSMMYTVSYVNYFIIVGYYFLCELTMQRTIGKFATNSVVINEFAEAPESSSLIGRSFSRLVPFEAFSCFADRGWHDKWSNTYVVTVNEREKLKRLLGQQHGVYISDREDLLD